MKLKELRFWTRGGGDEDPCPDTHCRHGTEQGAELCGRMRKVHDAAGVDVEKLQSFIPQLLLILLHPKDVLLTYTTLS